MREPRKMEPEAFRRMLRERQGLCPACGCTVEGVDRFHLPGMERPDRPVIWCTDCEGHPAYGILEALQRQYVQYEREPGRADREAALFEGMPGSHEGRDECWYVWVDGQFECVESMSNAKLDAMLARMKSLGEADRGKMERAIAEEEERIRAIYARSTTEGRVDESRGRTTSGVLDRVSRDALEEGALALLSGGGGNRAAAIRRLREEIASTTGEEVAHGL